MIAEAVNLILSELRSAIAKANAGTGAPDHPTYVTAGNIAYAEAPPDPNNHPLQPRVVASVVNIAEEAAFKNAPHYERNGDKTRYRNAPAFINLFLLFTANYAKYETSLKRLSQVITFFQGKNVFTLKNAPQAGLAGDSTLEFRLILELFALTFEQVNYLWSSLGGKQMPFVLYKVRLVRIQADRTQRESPVIEEVVGTLDHVNAE